MRGASHILNSRRATSDCSRGFQAAVNGQALARRGYVFSVGSTGDTPVPSGDPPDGTATGIERKETVFSQPHITAISPGGSPGGAGGSPAPPTLNRFETHRLADFFSSGTQLAWIIDPAAELVEICRSLMQRRLLGPDGVLSGEETLPGLQYTVADLFKEWEW